MNKFGSVLIAVSLSIAANFAVAQQPPVKDSVVGQPPPNAQKQQQLKSAAKQSTQMKDSAQIKGNPQLQHKDLRSTQVQQRAPGNVSQAAQRNMDNNRKAVPKSGVPQMTGQNPDSGQGGCARVQC